MDLMLQHARAAARASRLANERLHAVVASLPAQEFHAPRAGFFPSLAKTLNHILRIDRYYLHALQGLGAMALSRHDAFVPAGDVATLRLWQREQDHALIEFCRGLEAPALIQLVELHRAGRVDREAVHRVLAHLAMHQTHHRGQAHAMLSSTQAKPPQLDEFLLASDAPSRIGDLKAEGWDDRSLLGLDEAV